jgi:8-oxo-dGTP pyrophosphatase MutT (NUDIX family)
MPQITDTPFYRVTAKALIFDDEGRLLLLRNHDDNWELPGGGWEHDESFDDCLRREIHEELGAEVATVGEVVCIYRGVSSRHGYHTLRIVVPVTLAHNDIEGGEDMQGFRFVDRAEFLTLDLTAAEGDILEFVDKFWPAASQS